MLVVFDTNVYISAFIVPGSRSEVALRIASRRVFELVISREILDETVGKLSSKFGYSGEELESVAQEIRMVATVVEPEIRLSVLEDEPDNRILECAVEAGASVIVTGDRELLALKGYEGIGVMTVAELLYTFPELGV